MAVDILVTGSIIFTGERLLRNGYVYIKNGKIVAVGEGPAPEEFTYATLLLGGEGRAVVPGLAAVSSASTYPIRFMRPRMSERVKYYKETSVKSLIAAALPAIYELHMSGVTTVIVEGLKTEIPLELSRLVGGFYGLAVPACSGEEPSFVPGVVAVSKIYSDDCPGEGDMKEDGGELYWGSTRLLALFNELSYVAKIRSISPWEASNSLRRALMLPPQVIKQGRMAEIAVFDVSRPPAMLLDMAAEAEIKSIYASGAKLESLISGEDVLVDTGEHLYIAEKQFREARGLAEKLVKRRPLS